MDREDLDRLLDCFNEPALPARRAEQTYQPRNGSWFELHFNYRVSIPCPANRSHWPAYENLRTLMQIQKDKWGVYREDWYTHVDNYIMNYYFMTRDAALTFRLTVDL